MLKMKVKGLESQVEQLKRASVDIQAQVQQFEITSLAKSSITL